MNIYGHEEKAVYTQECLDLLQQLPREGLAGEDAEIENFVLINVHTIIWVVTKLPPFLFSRRRLRSASAL